MKKYYEILGLEEGASKEEIEERYKKLSKELDPKNNNNEEFFKEEFEKLNEAYNAILKDSLLTNSKTNEANQNQVNNKNTKSNTDNNKKSSIMDTSNSNRKTNLIFGLLLSIIGLGIWGIFLQNMGFFVPNEDYAQKVKVINAVEVEGSVYVDGGSMSVEVDNTVGIDIQAINGHYNAFYDNYSKHPDEHYRLPVFTYDY